MKLPEEILELIFAELKLSDLSELGKTYGRLLEYSKAHDQGQVADNRLKLKTLASVARCSKRFERVARPLLYSVFPGQQVVASTTFLSTLLETSETSNLSLNVRHLLLDMAVFADHDHHPRNGYAAWLASIAHLPICRRVVNDFLKTTTGDPCIASFGMALLLTLCTNVTSIGLSLSPVWNNKRLVQLCDKLLHSQHVDGLLMPLHQLRGLTIQCNYFEVLEPPAGSPWDDAWLNFSEHFKVIEMLLRQPTVDTLTLCQAQRLDLDCLSLVPQLRKLCFWRVYGMKAGWLEDALQRCPKLVELVVVWSRCYMLVSADMLLREAIDYASLSTAVCRYAKDLECLVLDTRGTAGHMLGYGSTINLSGHKCLKQVTLDSRAFWSAPMEGYQTQTYRLMRDVLPTSLQSLTIVMIRRAVDLIQYNKLIVPDILSLAIEAPSTLRSIRLEAVVETQGWDGCSGFEGDAHLLWTAGWAISMKSSRPNDSELRAYSTHSTFGDYDALLHQGTQMTVKLDRVGIDSMSSEWRTAWTYELEQRRHKQQA